MLVSDVQRNIDESCNAQNQFVLQHQFILFDPRHLVILITFADILVLRS